MIYQWTNDWYIVPSLYLSLSLQAATSHHLGQNFSKMFDIKFENPNQEQVTI